MTDKLTPEQRHRCMSLIRSKDTKPELMVRKYLFACGFRFRIHVKRLPGTPDIVLRRYHTVIFVNGCFWHGHPDCPYYSIPKSNTEFWKNKISRNRSRDHNHRIALRDMGWHVIELWECQLRPKVRQENLEALVFTLNHISLLNFGAKEYTQENMEAPQAAEPENY